MQPCMIPRDFEIVFKRVQHTTTLQSPVSTSTQTNPLSLPCISPIFSLPYPPRNFAPGSPPRSAYHHNCPIITMYLAIRQTPMRKPYSMLFMYVTISPTTIPPASHPPKHINTLTYNPHTAHACKRGTYTATQALPPYACICSTRTS